MMLKKKTPLFSGINLVIVNVKFTPEQAQGGVQKYSSTLSLTSALEWGVWLKPRSGWFTPGKETRHPLCRRLGGPPRPVWTGAENLAPHRDSFNGPSSPHRVGIPTTLSGPISLQFHCLILPYHLCLRLPGISLWQTDYKFVELLIYPVGGAPHARLCPLAAKLP